MTARTTSELKRREARFTANTKRVRARAAERLARLRLATACWGCKAKLQPEPPPNAPSPWRDSLPRAWARVTIRCAFCMKTFCRRCALKHFAPHHIGQVACGMKVTPVKAFALEANGTRFFLAGDRLTAERKLDRMLVESGEKDPPRYTPARRRKPKSKEAKR